MRVSTNDSNREEREHHVEDVIRYLETALEHAQNAASCETHRDFDVNVENTQAAIRDAVDAIRGARSARGT